MMYSVIFSIISRIGLLVLTLISVKALSPVDYGGVSYFLNIINTFILVASAGCGVSTNLVISKYFDKDKQYCYDVIGFNFVIVFFLSILLWMIFLFFYFFIKTPVSIFFVAFVSFFIFLFSNINMLLENIYIGYGGFKELTNNSIYVFIVTVVSAVLLIINYGIYGAFISYLIYKAIALVINISRCKLNLKELDLSFRSKNGLDALKKTGLPTFLSSLMVAPVIGIAITLALVYTSYEKIAYFNWVYQIYLIAIFIPSALGGFILHKLSKSDQNKKNTIMSLLLVNFIFSLVIFIILIIFKKIILGYAGESYLIEANTMYWCMSAAIILYCINSVFSSVWVVINKAWIGMWLNVLWAIIFLIIVFFGIQYVGVDSLAIGFLFSYLVLFLIQNFIYFFYYKVEE